MGQKSFCSVVLFVSIVAEVNVNSAATACEFSQDLGNLGINLRFREFSKQSWEFRKFREILVIPNLQRLTSVVFIRYLTACHSAMFLQSLLLLISMNLSRF